MLKDSQTHTERHRRARSYGECSLHDDPSGFSHSRVIYVVVISVINDDSHETQLRLGWIIMKWIISQLKNKERIFTILWKKHHKVNLRIRNKNGYVLEHSPFTELVVLWPFILFFKWSSSAICWSTTELHDSGASYLNYQLAQNPSMACFFFFFDENLAWMKVAQLLITSEKLYWCSNHFTFNN